MTTKEGMCPRGNFGLAWASRKIAKCSAPNGKKVGTAGYKETLLFVPNGVEEPEGEEEQWETECS